MIYPAIDLVTLPDADLAALKQGVIAEQERRANLVSIPLQAAQMNTTYLDAAGRATGAAWVQPTGAFDAYPSGWQVTHEGKTWISNITANVWEPGVSSWAEVAAPGVLPDWVQPSGATDTYALGARVAHGGHAWTSLVANNVWEPVSSNAALWADDGPL